MKKRNINIDLIKCIAALFVISIHFLLNSEFYTIPIVSKKMIFMYFLRVILVSCVPLFLLSTGYLMCEKKLSKRYYKGIIKTICIYVLISFICVLFRNIYLNEGIGITGAIKGILNFTADSYSWYIKLYLGIFLLIPFLNIIINNITKKQYKYLIFTLILLTILPTLTNVFGLSSVSDFFSSNAFSGELILNDYWLMIWPLTYYFVGAYIKKYNVKYDVRKNFLLLIIFIGIFCYFNYFRNVNMVYVDALYMQYFGFEAFIISVLLFILMLNLNLEKINDRVKKGIIAVSNLSLGIYLSSKVFDTVIYTILKSKIVDVQVRILFFVPVVLTVFVCSIILSIIVNYIYKILYNIMANLNLRKKITFLVQKIQKIINKRKIFDLLFITSLIIICIIYIKKIRYGIGGSDESFYLTIPHRLAKGDALLYSEWHLSQMVAFITYPLMKLYLLFFNTESIILNFRIIFVIFKFIITLIIYFLIRKKKGFIAVPMALMFFSFTPYNILQFCYNSLGYILLIIISVIILTCDIRKKNILIILGILYSLSVLCCPYLLIIYILLFFILLLILAFRKKNYFNYFKYYTLGCILVGILFLIFILSRAGIKEIIKNITLMFLDPEHQVGGKLEVIKNMFLVHINYIPKITFGFLLIFILITIDGIISKGKRLIGGNIYPILAMIIYIIGNYDLASNILYHYNFIMIPLAYVGFICLYQLLWERKFDKELFRCLIIWLIGFIYSLSLIFSSNQLFYIYSVGLSISSFISIYILYIFMHKNILTKQIYNNIYLMLLLFVIVFQLIIQSYSLAIYSYNQGDVRNLNYKIKYGPYKGLITNKETREDYYSVINDLNVIKNKNGDDNFICYDLKPYVYLYVDKGYSTHSAWSGNIDAQIKIDREYYKLHKDKRPKYLYISKKYKDKTNEILKIYSGNYDIMEKESGTIYVERESNNEK